MKYTRTGYWFTDIYDHEVATFTYPSGEAGVLALSGVWDTDVFAPSYYSGMVASYLDVNITKTYTPGKNWH